MTLLQFIIERGYQRFFVDGLEAQEIADKDIAQLELHHILSVSANGLHREVINQQIKDDVVADI
jgi:hypothetical protein